MLGEIVQAAKVANTGLSALTAGQRVLAAIETGELSDVIEASHDVIGAFSPPLGNLTRGIHEQFRTFRAQGGQIIEGEYREIGTPARVPWASFINWLMAQRWGTFVLLGPKGGGKTTLAFRLAQRWHEQTGWPVDAINVYAGDVPTWAKKRPSWWFMGLTKRITDILDPPEPGTVTILPSEKARVRVLRSEAEITEAADDFLDMEEIEPSIQDERFIARYSRRILVIDEMSTFCGSSSSDPRRALVRKIMHQARHLNWLIIFIGQIAKHVPEDLLNCEAVFIKKPLGDEAETDRDNPMVSRLWHMAEQTFTDLRTSPWRDLDNGDYRDIRSWAMVYSRPSGANGYFGPVPFKLPTEGASE